MRGKKFCEIIVRNVEGQGGFNLPPPPPPPVLLGFNWRKEFEALCNETVSCWMRCRLQGGISCNLSSLTICYSLTITMATVKWQCFIANQNQECHCTCQWMTNCQCWQVSWNAPQINAGISVTQCPSWVRGRGREAKDLAWTKGLLSRLLWKWKWPGSDVRLLQQIFSIIDISPTPPPYDPINYCIPWNNINFQFVCVLWH